MLRSNCFRGASFALASITIGLSACTRQDKRDADNAVLENEPVASSLPSLPAVEPPLDRAAVLLAVEQAASAAALGRDDRAEQAKLDGKRIEGRIRFGCPEAAPDVRDAPFQVRFSPDDRTLRLRAVPDVTSKEMAIAPGAAEANQSSRSKDSGSGARGSWRPLVPCLNPSRERSSRSLSRAANRLRKTKMRRPHRATRRGDARRSTRRHRAIFYRAGFSPEPAGRSSLRNNEGARRRWSSRPKSVTIWSLPDA